MCSEWRNIVKQDSQIGRRWREFLDERKRHFTRKGKVIRGSILIYKNDISLYYVLLALFKIFLPIGLLSIVLNNPLVYPGKICNEMCSLNINLNLLCANTVSRAGSVHALFPL